MRRPARALIHGEPTPEAAAAERRGELILAGFVITEPIAESACIACGFEVPYPEGRGPCDDEALEAELT